MLGSFKSSWASSADTDSAAHDILVVDDTPANLIAVEAALGELAGRVVRAESGTEALRLLLDRDFALILLDVLMPSLDGFETARLIRQRQRSRHTPIIFITGQDRESQDVLAAYSLGAVDFLFKPIVPEILRAKVQVFVDLRRQTAEVARQAALLREHERRELERTLEEERRRWHEEALRRQRDEAQRAAEALERKAEELARTVAEKERAEGELVRINHELAEADRRKDEFLALLGHELRNPLAPISAGLEVLRRKLGEGPEVDPVIRRTRLAMERQCRHLTRLVDDLLDISRINSGKLELRRSSTRLQDVLEQAVVTSRPSMDERQHTLTVEQPPEPVSLFVDPVRLTQVVANLLNNAARYTERGGRIRLVGRRDGEFVSIHVIDNGRGIPAELLPTIFEPFVQETAGGGGLGLGLALVQRLVNMHGGTVSVRSEGANRGAEFIVRIPILPATAEVVEPGAKVGGAEEPTPARKVVLVEDNADIRDTMTELLTMWGHDVHVAADGAAGADLICRLQPQVAFVDIGLPTLDGYGVAAHVRKMLGPTSLRLIAMSGYGQESDRRRALQAGFDAHLVKPADISVLFSLLSSPGNC